MSSTTPSTPTGARNNTALLPTLGLGGGAQRAGNGGEGSGAAFSDLLRDKIAAPKPEPQKTASPAPAPAAQAAPAQPAAKARKAESHQDNQDQAASEGTSGAADDAETAATQEAGSTEARTDTRHRRAAKGATGQALKPDAQAARAQQQPGEPLTLHGAADETTATAAADTGDEAAADDAAEADASVAQAILQMINAPASVPVKAAAIASASTEKKAADGTPDAALQAVLPQGLLTADAAASAAAPQGKSATAQGQATLTAAADQLKLGDATDAPALAAAGEALLTRAAEALAAPNAQTPSGGPGSFAAHLQALSNPRAAQAAGNSAPSAVALAQPLHSPEFAPALSARLALLAAEGVQQAQLQLNPAEMGPVSVQITVEGQQAQIAFHAVQAETRQVLEQSLPELAAALRDQGLTLSGGGVFEQSQQQAREQARQAASGTLLHAGGNGGLPGDADLSSAQAVSARTPASRGRGMLDLYA